MKVPQLQILLANHPKTAWHHLKLGPSNHLCMSISCLYHHIPQFNRKHLNWNTHLVYPQFLNHKHHTKTKISEKLHPKNSPKSSTCCTDLQQPAARRPVWPSWHVPRPGHWAPTAPAAPCALRPPLGQWTPETRRSWVHNMVWWCLMLFLCLIPSTELSDFGCKSL